MKIYPAEISEKFIRKVNSYLYVFERHGTGNFMVKVNEVPLEAEWVKRAFGEIDFPLGWMQYFEVYIMPYKLAYLDSNMIPDGYYQGQAFPTHFVMGTRNEYTYDATAVVVTHETGHILTYKFIDPVYEDHKNTEKLKEYMNLRGLDPKQFGYGYDWNFRVWEVLAEDFRYLFGGSAAHSETFLHEVPYVGLQPPGEDIRRWFFDAVPEEQKHWPVEIEIVGREEQPEMNKPEYVIIHHSATAQGDAEAFRKAHKAKGWKDIGYHYVIGNGTYSGDGEIEAGRAENEVGAHCSAGGMNNKSIGICLVGNFDEQTLTPAQMQSLENLTRAIIDRHKIPAGNILGHKEVPGAATSCPGKNFDMPGYRKRMEGMHLKDYEGHWAEEYITKVMDDGIMQGYPDGSFKPDQPVTRAELATVLAKIIERGLMK